jgi:hypothetical protein
MRGAREWLLTALIVGLAVLVAVPFAVDAVSSTCMPWDGRVETHLTIETADAQDGQVEVAGTTDLPDGAVVSYFFLHEDELGDVRTLPRYQAGGATSVHDGRLRFTEDLSGWPDGAAVLDLWFEVGPDAPQPAHVVEAFGATGQCLSGPQVSSDSPGDRKGLLTQARVTLPNSVGP